MIIIIIITSSSSIDHHHHHHHHWSWSSSSAASSSSSSRSISSTTHAQKPLLNSNPWAQSNREQNFCVALSVTPDQKQYINWQWLFSGSIPSIGSLRSYCSDAEDNVDYKINLHFTHESRDTPKSFNFFITVKTITRLNLEQSDKFENRIWKS